MPAKTPPAKTTTTPTTKPAIVVEADAIKAKNKNHLPASLKKVTERVDDQELAKRLQGLIERHGFLTPTQLQHVLSWGVDKEAGRVPSTVARVKVALELLRAQVPAQPAPKRTRSRKVTASA